VVAGPRTTQGGLFVKPVTGGKGKGGGIDFPLVGASWNLQFEVRNKFGLDRASF